MSKTVMIVCNGEPLSAERATELAEEAEVIIAADGGADYCLEHSIRIDHLIGDLDSISDAALKSIQTSRKLYIPDQNYTDLQKSLAFCITLQPEKIIIINTLGSRSDHALTNLLFFQDFPSPELLEIHDNFGCMKILDPGEYDLKFDQGQTISFFSSASLTDLTLTGVQYPVINESYTIPFTGISNKAINETVMVKFSEGKLFVYEVFNEKKANSTFCIV